MAKQRRTQWFTLPREIRDMIYWQAILLDETRDTIGSLCTEFYRNDSGVVTITSRPAMALSVSYGEMSIANSILRASKQLSREFLEVAALSAAFQFESGLDAKIFSCIFNRAFTDQISVAPRTAPTISILFTPPAAFSDDRPIIFTHDEWCETYSTHEIEYGTEAPWQTNCWSLLRDFEGEMKNCQTDISVLYLQVDSRWTDFWDIGRELDWVHGNTAVLAVAVQPCTPEPMHDEAQRLIAGWISEALRIQMDE